MTAALGAVLTVLATVMWDNRVIEMMSDGRALTYRTVSEGWAPSYCVTRNAGVHELAEGEQCDNHECSECFISWHPGYEYPQQGTVNQFVARQTSEMQNELDELRRRVTYDMIDISHVQQVAHDYAVHGEWCSVYEQAMETLSNLSGKDVSPLDNTTDIMVTYTVNMTVRADRRQRIGDVDFMQRSLRHWAIQEAMESFDPFDSDYQISDVSVVSTEVEPQ